MVLVDQAGLDRLGGEVGPAHRDIAFRRRFQPADRFGVEVSLDARPGAGCLLERPRIDDLVRRLPDLLVVANNGRFVSHLHRLPGHHHLVHTAAQQVRADGALELVDEGVHLFVGRRPIEAAVPVRHVAVQRHDRRVDEPGHAGS